METIIKEEINKYAKKFYENLLADNYKMANGDYYKEARSHVAIECPVGHVYQTTPDNFNGSKRRKGKRCARCAGVYKLTHDEVCERIRKLFGNEYTLLTKYKNSWTTVKIRHNNEECGNYEWDIYVHNLTHKKQKCPKCARNAPSNTEEFRQRIDDLTGGEYTVLGEYRNADTPILIKHNNLECNNHEWSVVPFNFTTHVSRCPICNQSRGEKRIFDFLIKNKVPFETQVYVDGCKNKKKLLFDFAVYRQDKIVYLIEMQGIQHYEPVKYFGGEKRFVTNQINDQIKRDFCKRNGIPLLEIPYWKISEIEKILLDAIKK